MNRIYRADHWGSLIRPDTLKKTRTEFVHGRVGRDTLEAIEDEAVLRVLELQRQVGLDIYSDGEFRRGSWLAAISDEFFEGMRNEGIDYLRHPYLKDKKVEDPDVEVPPNSLLAGKLRLKKRITGSRSNSSNSMRPVRSRSPFPAP